MRLTIFCLEVALHKVSKENMLGLYVALKKFIASDEEAMPEAFRNRLIPIVQLLSPIAVLRNFDNNADDC